MAKVTIIIEDTDDGECGCKFNFDPPLKKGVEPTAAQMRAILIAEHLTEDGGGEVAEVNEKPI